jgi:hypothetical protein
MEMADCNCNAKAALDDAVQKIGRARLAVDLAHDLIDGAHRQIGTANDALATAGTLLQSLAQEVRNGHL